MKNFAEQSTPTFESVWATLQETGRQIQERDRQMQERDRQMQERDRVLSEQSAEMKREHKEKVAEFWRLFEKTEARMDKNAQEAEKYRIAAERDRIAAEKDRIAAEKRIKNLEELMGGWSNSHGSFAEEYFFNSFEENQRDFFGEKFDEIEKNVKGIKKDAKDEYDILLINGKSIGIIEVKFKVRQNDIPKVLKKAKTFRINFPEYENHKVYLGLATLVFSPELEQECINEGIAVVKQVGNTVVINDGHLKVF
jgi:hypothetical protein